MKVVVIGATGTIGAAVAKLFAREHEVIGASRHCGTRIDIQDRASIRAFFADLRRLDAVICCAGEARFGDLAALTEEEISHSLANKLRGQIDVARHALASLVDGGSITLTSGHLGRVPMKGTAAIATVDAGVEGFVRAAALDAPRGVRINAVSPGWVRETMAKMGMDPTPGVAAADVARAYAAAALGTMTGAVLTPRDPWRPAEAYAG